MDYTEIIFIAIGIVIIVFVKRLKSTSKKCSVCGVDAKDVYVDINNKKILLCRNHLVDAWKRDLVSSSFDIIMLEPEFVKYKPMNIYGNMLHFKEWQNPDDVEVNLTNIRNSIKDKTCNDCGRHATVAYVKKEDYKFPFLEELKPPEIHLCKNCVVKKIELNFRGYTGIFEKGVCAPTSSGVYIMLRNLNYN